MTALVGPGPDRWRRVAMVLPFIVLVLLNGAFTYIVQQQTEEKLCRVTDVMMTGAPAPTTPRQQEVRAAMERFRDELGC